LSRRNDRFALASVIAKAAQGRAVAANVAFAPLGGAGVLERVRQLLDESAPVQRPRATALRMIAVGMAVVTIALTAALPATVVANVEQLPADAAVRHCAG
jgi:hypothetical protein